MTKYVASILCVLLIGCAATSTGELDRRAASAPRPKAMASLDKTYDWGSKPPNAAPDRIQD